MRDTRDFIAGQAYVLDTLGISREMFESIVIAKLAGNKSFIVSIKYADIAPDDFVNTTFLEEGVRGSIDDGSGPVEYKGNSMSTYGFLAGGLSESTGAGYSPDGDALYTCPRCPGLHRKYEECPKPQYDTGDPWDSASDGNPFLK